MEFRIKTIKEADKPDRYQPQVYGAPTSLASIPMPRRMYIQTAKDYSGGDEMSIWRDLVVYKYEIIAWDPFISSFFLRDYMEKYPVQKQSWETPEEADVVIFNYKHPGLAKPPFFQDAPEVGKRSEYRDPIVEIQKRGDRNFLIASFGVILFVLAMWLVAYFTSTY